MKNKQGCVDWLVKEINKQKAWADPSKLDPIIEQAKAMHREEVKESYREGRSDQQSPRNVHFYHRNAESYYNETFGGES